MRRKVPQVAARPREAILLAMALAAAPLLLGVLAMSSAHSQGAATPTPAADGAQDRSGAAAAADPIKGVDAMSGKDRSGPDGWSWAPVSRSQGASADAPGEKNTNQQHAAQQAKVPSTGSQAPGEDPGAPLETRQPGPAGTVPSSPTAK